jgi:anti-sigma-K factor RskA
MTQSIWAEAQELAAGYVLEDLNGTELTTFEALLAHSLHLQVEVYMLQVAFHQLPQSLETVSPPPALQARLLEIFLQAMGEVSEAIDIAAPSNQLQGLEDY